MPQNRNEETENQLSAVFPEKIVEEKFPFESIFNSKDHLQGYKTDCKSEAGNNSSFSAETISN